MTDTCPICGGPVVSVSSTEGTNAVVHLPVSAPVHFEWTDEEGRRAVVYEGHLSVYGKPSMTADDGTIAIGIDLAPLLRKLND